MHNGEKIKLSEAYPVHMIKSGSGKISFMAYIEELMRCHGESQT